MELINRSRNQMDFLYEKIKKSENYKTIIHNKEKVQEMINIPWILFFLLLAQCCKAGHESRGVVDVYHRLYTECALCTTTRAM